MEKQSAARWESLAVLFVQFGRLADRFSWVCWDAKQNLQPRPVRPLICRTRMSYALLHQWDSTHDLKEDWSVLAHSFRGFTPLLTDTEPETAKWTGLGRGHLRILWLRGKNKKERGPWIRIPSFQIVSYWPLIAHLATYQCMNLLMSVVPPRASHLPSTWDVGDIAYLDHNNVDIWPFELLGLW